MTAMHSLRGGTLLPLFSPIPTDDFDRILFTIAAALSIALNFFVKLLVFLAFQAFAHVVSQQVHKATSSLTRCLLELVQKRE